MELCGMRASDQIDLPLQKRSARFFEQDGQWYFRSREGIRFGGYPTSFDAELAAVLLFSRVNQAEDITEVWMVMTHFMQMQLVYGKFAQKSLLGSARLPAAMSGGTAAEHGRWQMPTFRRWFDQGMIRSG